MLPIIATSCVTIMPNASSCFVLVGFARVESVEFVHIVYICVCWFIVMLATMDCRADRHPSPSNHQTRSVPSSSSWHWVKICVNKRKSQSLAGSEVIFVRWLVSGCDSF